MGEAGLQDCLSAAGARMPYDIAVVRNSDRKIMLIIEVDGLQHFVDGLLLGTNFEATQRNDFQKEMNAVSKRIPMIRLYQRAVYRGKFDWRLYLKQMLAQAWSGGLPVKVYRHPGESVYQLGEYRRLREGTILEV